MENNIDCPFCSKNIRERIILRNDRFFAVYDLYPVSQGHILIIPKRHISSFFDLSRKEVLDFYSLLNKAHREIIKEFSPDGFNIGINNGEVAGQTIPHLHIHLIPRYAGDVSNPEGGIRKMMPNLIEYQDKIIV